MKRSVVARGEGGKGSMGEARGLLGHTSVILHKVAREERTI